MKKLLILIAAALLPAAAQAAGPVCDAHWTDPRRDNRDIPVRIRMPEGTAKAPVILFSHGLGGSVDSGRAWAEAWADAGMIVINIQHDGSDRAAIATGLRNAMTPEQFIARAIDVHFVIDEIVRHPHEGACDLSRADLSHIGMSGHSFGAITTQAIAGQHFALRDDDPLADRRVIAAIAFSPSPPKQGSDEAAFGQIRIPFLSVTGTADTVFLTPQIKAEDRQRPFHAMAPGGKYLLVLDGANHMAFNGRGDRAFASAALTPHIEQAVIDTTTAFWRWTLMGDQAAKAKIDQGDLPLDAKDDFERK